MRRIRLIAAWLALGAFVFAQLATAAYACPELGERPVAVKMAGCDHEMNQSPNLCERHCDYGNTSLDNPKPLAAPDMAVTFARPVLVVATPPAPRAENRARISTGPPLTRFTVLRI